uniref:Uncharacterized protein n=1 Tax=Glossina austeni TaxID=7395 RepID=A0A1A9V3Y2_GLOAU
MTTASVCVRSFRLLIRQTAKDFTHYKRQNASSRIVPTMITFSAPAVHSRSFNSGHYYAADVATVESIYPSQQQLIDDIINRSKLFQQKPLFSSRAYLRSPSKEICF